MSIMLEAALRSSALIVFVWFVALVLKVRSPGFERTAWIVVLSSSLVMPFLIGTAWLPTEVSPTIALPIATIGSMTVGAEDSQWGSIALWIYATAAGLLCVRHLVGLVKLWRLRAAAVRLFGRRFGALDVRVSRSIQSPATLFSTIVVPIDFERWPTEQQNAVIAHEGAHVANRDFFVQSLAQLHRHLFWFNPLAWWLPRRLALLNEHLSDDAAVETLRERTAYAELLIQFARNAAPNHGIAMARKATIAARIERILDAHPVRRATRGMNLALVLSLLPFVAFAAGAKWNETIEQHASASRLTPLRPDATSPAPWEQGNTPAALHRVILPRSNPLRPLSQPPYPQDSRRLGETGTVVLHLHVLEDGSVGDAAILRSTGYPALDYSAMYESFKWKLDPGTIDGQPQRMWGKFAVTFKIKGDLRGFPPAGSGQAG